jgi:hypothetical protein
LLSCGIGLAARAINNEYCSTDYPTLENDDGTIAFYDYEITDWPQYETVDGAEGKTAVYVTPREGAERQLVFEGSQEEAADWMISRGNEPVFEGTRAEADAWAHKECGDLTSTTLIAGGALLAVLSLVLGWQRRID